MKFFLRVFSLPVSLPSLLHKQPLCRSCMGDSTRPRCTAGDAVRARAAMEDGVAGVSESGGVAVAMAPTIAKNMADVRVYS